MRDLVLGLITSYETRISMADELVTSHYTMATLGVSLAAVEEDRASLKASLQEMLARNCSLRRKDFNALMERLASDSERKKRELEEERERVKEELKGYLDEQRQLTSSLRQQLVNFNDENTDKNALEATMDNLHVVCQQKGQQVFALLHDFKLRLEAFQREREEINQKLQRLVERGESLRLEDLRQLEAAELGQARGAERELRRQDVARLLTHFKAQRQRAKR